MRALLTLAVAGWLVANAYGARAAGAPPGARLATARMTFEEARRPYARSAYVYSGHVARDGTVRNGGLGCSAFTSVVLHRMRDGDGWLARYDLRVHQWYGHRAAEHFGLVQ